MRKPRSTVTLHGRTNVPVEFAVGAARCSDPFNRVEVDVVFTGPGGREWRVPALWAGDGAYRVTEQIPVRWPCVTCHPKDYPTGPAK